jgi:hypothetical protein
MPEIFDANSHAIFSHKVKIVKIIFRPQVKHLAVESA